MPEWIFENFETARVKQDNFKIFKNHEGDLSQKLLEPNMRLLLNHIKPTNTLRWNYYLLTAGNYRSSSGQLQNIVQLQNNTVGGAMSITIRRVIITIINNTAFHIKGNKSSYKTERLCEKRGYLLPFINERQYINTVSYITTASPFYYTSIRKRIQLQSQWLAMEGKEPEKRTLNLKQSCRE